jgi:hypothetical protein
VSAHDSDDFNLGHVAGNKLVGFSWMRKPLNDHVEDAAPQLGLVTS